MGASPNVGVTCLLQRPNAGELLKITRRLGILLQLAIDAAPRRGPQLPVPIGREPSFVPLLHTTSSGLTPCCERNATSFFLA